MPIDEAGFKKVGTGYVKSPTKALAGTGGQEVFIGGKGFPPYVVPTRYWLTTKMVGTSTVAPDASADYAVRGIAVPVSRNQGIGATGQDLMEKYGSPFATGSDWLGATVMIDVGIGGTEAEYTAWYKKREIFQRKASLGLPDKAVFSTDSVILYVDQFSTKGKIDVPFVIDEPKFVGFGLTGDEPTYDTSGTNWNAILWGDADDLPDFTELVVGEFFDSANDVAIAVGQGFRDSDFAGWMTKGTSSNEAEMADAAANIAVRTRLTIAYDVYVPLAAAGGFRVISSG